MTGGAAVVTNPASVAVDQAFDVLIRRNFFKGVIFDAPEGDPGWFGPGSAVWYVHEHTPALVLGLFASAAIETLHPDFAWMGQQHSRGVRWVNGEPSGLDLKGLLTRAGHSYSFFMAVAYGPNHAADRVVRTVRGMHGTVRGVRPDGRGYDAADPETLRWAYATVVWGIASAHERYHPRPLRGVDLDVYYREFTRVGEALGGADLPATKSDVRDCLRASIPLMGVTMPTVEFLAGLGGAVSPAPLRPALRLLQWAVLDLQPRWAQRLLRVPRSSSTSIRLHRAAMWSALNGIHYAAGPLPETRAARARVGLSTTTRLLPRPTA